MDFHKTSIRLWPIVLMSFIGILSACQGFGHSVDSRKILSGHLLLIPRQGPLHITWESRQLTIAIKGKVDQSLLTMDGRIDITDGGIRNVSLLDQLLVNIYFAKSDGSVLDRRNVYAATKSPAADILPYTFTLSFDLPKGTTHIAFGYDGTVLEGGSGVLQRKGAAVEHSFRHSPFR